MQTPTTATPPIIKLTHAQQIQALEEEMDNKECGAYLDNWDMGKDFCSAGT